MADRQSPPWQQEPDAPRAELPTVAEMLGHTLEELDNARNGLSEAAAWLRSDWSPAGSSLTAAESAARSTARAEIATAKAAIDRAKAALYEALP
jgi:hypothetical protein